MLHAAPTIRRAMPADTDALRQLAAVSKGRRSRGPALIAQRGSTVIAAIALTSGTVLVDPQRAEEDAVHLLRRRRYQLLRQGGNAGPARSLLWRRARSLSM